MPFTLAASGTPASASSSTTSAKRAITRPNRLPRVGRLAMAHRALPDAVLHQAYSFQFHVRDTRARLSWAAIGSLPPGLSLDARTGTLSGVPTTAGSSAVMVSASAAGHRRAVGYADTVLTVERPTITDVAVQRAGLIPGSRPVVRIWGAGFGVAPPVRGRPGTATRTGTPGGPAGFQVRDASRSAAYGAGPGYRPLVIESWTDHQIVAVLGPSHGAGPVIAAGDRLAVLADGARWAGKATVSPATGARTVLPLPTRALKASAGVPYQVTLAAAGGGLPVSWSITTGRLPAGLTLDRSSGVINGTPVKAGTRAVTIKAAGPGASAARSRITIAVSDDVTIPAQTVAASLYQGLYFGQLNSTPELENLLLADVATGTYAGNPAADPATVRSELAALKTAFDTATNPTVSGTGTGLTSFGPTVVAQLTGALGVMISFASSNQGDVISGAVLAAARSIYTQYLQSNLANAIGFGQGYAGFNDRAVYDTGDVAGSSFHALVSGPIIAQAAACGQASAACATVIDSLLQPVTGASSAATPAQLVSADPALGTMLTTLGLTLNSDGSVTTSATGYDNALNTVDTQVSDTSTTNPGTVQTESADIASLIANAGDPAAPSDPSGTTAASATDVNATLPQVDAELTESSFLSGLGNTVDPADAGASSSTLLGGVSIVQGTVAVLQALGSDDATQNTEIADTIGAFIDVCTGNFADAIKNVFGLVSAVSGTGNSEAYQLASQVETEINTVYNNLSAQLNQVESGLNAVRATLNNLYSTMKADFQDIDFALDTVSQQLSADIVDLNALQYSIDVTDQNLLNITSAEVNGTIQGNFYGCLDYASRFPTLPPLTVSAYQSCEGEFKTDATSVGVAANPGVELHNSGPYDNVTIATNLQRGYDVSANLWYLLTILNNRWPTDDPTAPPADLVNPDVWAEAALGYRELLDENLDYSAGPELDTAAVEQPGQQVASAISALQKVETSSDPNPGQSPIVNDVAGNYSSALNQLTTDLNSHMSNFNNDNPGWDSYNPTSGPEQQRPLKAPDPAQPVSGLPFCGGGTTDAVVFPQSSWESGLNVPNSWYLVSDVGGQAQSGYQQTPAPLCANYSEKFTGVHCNPKSGICESVYAESGSVSFQYLGLNGSLNPIETLNTATLTAYCPSGYTLIQCGIDPNDYFNGFINGAGSLQQFLINIGGKTTTPDTSALDSDGNTILTDEQNAIYNWGIDGLTVPGTTDYTELSGDVNSMAGAFELLQGTAQLVAPSAALGNQAISDILYGNDELPSDINSPNNPAALFEALLNRTSTTTLSQWENAQTSRITELQRLLNGYLNSATQAGSLTTAEVPALVLSTLDQLNTGMQLGLVDKAPAITSATSAAFTTGTAGSFQVTATGSPAPTLSETGTLPAGVTFTSAGLLSGTPAAGTGGVYPLTITAANGIGTAATQNFTLTVTQPPAITSAASAAFTTSQAGSFQVTATGQPAPTFSETGALPAGVTFTSGGLLSGTLAAGSGGVYPLTITAANGIGTAATQNFTLTVNQSPAIKGPGSVTYTRGQKVKLTINSSGYPVPALTWTGKLPAGLKATKTSGKLTITGTVSTSATIGKYKITVTATNSAGKATKTITITVKA